MRKFYVVTIAIATILCYFAVCYAGVLARVVYWSKLSVGGGEDSKWNTVLIATEYVLLIMVFYNLVDIVIKDLSIQYMPKESGYFSRQFDYPPSYIYNRNMSSPFEEVWSVQQT